MIAIDRRRAARDLLSKIERVFVLSGSKVTSIEEAWRPEDGAPVFTVQGRYRARGWPERRWGRPDDVGRVVAALVRGDFPYATGTVMSIEACRCLVFDAVWAA